MELTKQDYNPPKITKKEDEELFKKLSKRLGNDIQEAYIMPTILNAWAAGYNAAIEDMKKGQ